MSARVRTRRAAIGSFAFAAALTSRTVDAQTGHATRTATAAPSTPHAIAAARFAAGVRLAEDYRWQDAVREFEAARAAEPSAPVYYNLGLAYRAVGRARDAIAAFEAFLASGVADPDRTGLAQSYLASLRETVCDLGVALSPAAAHLTLDGATLADPAAARPIDPGPHVLVASAPGFHPETRNIALPPGAHARLTVRLVPLDTTGRLVVRSSVARAAIAIDGRVVSRGAVELRLHVGRHAIDVRADDYAPFHADVAITPGGSTRVSATLIDRRTVWTSPWFWSGVALVATVVVIGAIWQPWVPPTPQYEARFGTWPAAQAGGM